MSMTLEEQKLAVKEQVALARVQLLQAGIGVEHTFNPSDELQIVDVPADILDNLLHKDVTIYSNGEMYYIVQNGHPLYLGHVDAEGVLETIIHDLTKTSLFIDYSMCIANNDVDSLFEMITQPDFAEEYSRQLVIGYTKGSSNGHY